MQINDKFIKSFSEITLQRRKPWSLS